MSLSDVASGNSGFLFFLVYKNVAGQQYKPIYKSEIKPYQNGMFRWNAMSLLTAEMANEELEREITMRCGVQLLTPM